MPRADGKTGPGAATTLPGALTGDNQHAAVIVIVIVRKRILAGVQAGPNFLLRGREPGRGEQEVGAPPTLPCGAAPRPRVHFLG